MQLSQILYEIKVNGDLNFLRDLMRDEQIKNTISGVCKRHKCKANIVRELLKDYTVRCYRYDENFIEERYLNNARKYLGRRVRQLNGRDINNR
jgi:hypothetical protein